MLNKMRDNGFNPDAIIDVGACIGDWMTAPLTAFPNADFYAFEPNQDVWHKLIAFAANYPGRIVLENRAVWNKTQKLTMNFSGQHTSFFPDVNGKRWGEKRSVKAITLDECGFEAYNNIFLKMDVQGGELKVLEGANDLLASNKIEAIVLEASLFEFQKGIPLYPEVFDIMHSLSFGLWGVINTHYRTLDKRPGQLDLMFVHNSSQLVQDNRWSKKENGMPEWSSYASK